MRSIPEIGNRISELGPGDHACFYYDLPDEKIAALTFFIRNGLERNERCLYLADPDSGAAIKASLEDDGVDVGREVGRGALVITSRRDYLQENRFDGDRVLGFLDLALVDALKAGFSGLRGTGDMLWEVGTVSELCRLRKYETDLDAFFHGKKLTGLCQYHSRSIPAEYLIDSLASHRTVLFGGKFRRKNPYYRQAMDWAAQRSETANQETFHRMRQEVAAASGDV